MMCDGFIIDATQVSSMSTQVSAELSSEATTLKRICDHVAESVDSSIREMIGDPASGQVTKMGADGTPTKRIDRRAEAVAISSFEKFGLEFTILSEEMGKKVVGENPEYFIYLPLVTRNYD